MAGGKGKIQEHPNAGTNGFEKRPNEAGRPRKNYKQHIDSIKKKGYVAPSREEYFDMIGLLLSMDEKDLTDFKNDKDKPYWIRLIVIDLSNKNTRQRMMADYRDWLFGKAEQRHDITHHVEQPLFNINDENGEKESK